MLLNGNFNSIKSEIETRRISLISLCLILMLTTLSIAVYIMATKLAEPVPACEFFILDEVPHSKLEPRHRSKKDEFHL